MPARAALAAIVLLLAAAGAWAQQKEFVPDNFPANIAPVDWPGNPGTRYAMPELVKKYPLADIVLKTNVAGWTKELHEKGEMGKFTVGDRVSFSTIPGDRNSRYFGSVKDGGDGGRYLCTIFWMDEGGQAVAREDATSVKPACATCDGKHNMYFDVPSFARTGRHRLVQTYKHVKLGLDLKSELAFEVVNDGSWDKSAAMVALKGKPVVILQSGQPCKELGIERYGGVQDADMIAPNQVPDRRADHVNSGACTVLRVGSYGMENRALIRFDLAAVGKSVEVEEAWLELYVATWPGRHAPKTTVQAFEVLKEWNAGRGLDNPYKNPVMAGEASWQCNQYPAKWDKPGCDEPGKDRAAQPAGQSAPVTANKTWVSIKLDKELLARWIKAPAGNRGLVLVDAQNGRCDFHSGEYEDAAMRPRLVLSLR